MIAVLFCGCTPRQQGAATQGFYSTGPIAFSVGVNPPLALVSTGMLLGDVPSDALIGPPGTFAYALFSDTGEGLVARHVHAIASELPQPLWRWEMESWPKPESLLHEKMRAGGEYWTVQILPVTARADWFSALWQLNGRDTADFWLSKRWSASPADGTRLVLEYREPAPLCMRERLVAADTALRTDRNAPMLRGRALWAGCDQDIEEFSRRADAAVNLGGLEQLPEKPLRMMTARPKFSPDMGKLVGRAEIVEPLPSVIQ
jgi:hypothetical protein